MAQGQSPVAVLAPFLSLTLFPSLSLSFGLSYCAADRVSFRVASVKLVKRGRERVREGWPATHGPSMSVPPFLLLPISFSLDADKLRPASLARFAARLFSLCSRNFSDK